MSSDIDLSEFETPDRLPDATYEVPEWMNEADPAMAELFDTVVNNLMLEAAQTERPLSTFEQLLMERVAFNYVSMRFKERANDFDKQTSHMQAQKFWLEVSKEFETRVKGTESEALARIVKQSFARALTHIPDPKLRELVSVQFGDSLRDAGM